ncbi:histidine kinase CKI1 [Populus alba x Populus x berolinensis]|nr:histidine kinase CKI1 [Populus alba x Populus x berolinensis]
MQLEEEEFDLAKLLEDAVDLYHPVRMKKGVDVVLDPYDGSILKHSRVKGDMGKLKQVMCNLLSNAVKFTFEGHVSVQAWTQKPSLENKIIASNQNGMWRCKGILREKKKSVLDNFVQVKETTLGQGGTGLGLGIVQSLIHLMGGEIGIVNKENGEKGSCFKFNVFLYICEIPLADIQNAEVEIEEDSMPDEGLRSSKKYIEGLGIKVSYVKKCEHHHSTLKRIKARQNVSPYSSSRKSDLGSRSDHFKYRSMKDVPLSFMDEIEQKPSANRSSNLRGVPGFVLLMIDGGAGPFQELCRVVGEFKRDLHSSCCKIVWLDKPTSRSTNLRGFEQNLIDPRDGILLKPFHDSRLHQAEDNSKKEKNRKNPLLHDPDHSHVRSKLRQSPTERVTVRSSEIQEARGNLSKDKSLNGLKFFVVDDNEISCRVTRHILKRHGATVEVCENGEEAFQLVRIGRHNQKEHSDSIVLPYDYILMDCEMPKINGCEATRQIRKEEKFYGVHIPMLAFSADNSGDENKKLKEDFMRSFMVFTSLSQHSQQITQEVKVLVEPGPVVHGGAWSVGVTL